jgi:hypothetical protein
LLNTNPDDGPFSSNPKAENFHDSMLNDPNQESFDNAESVYHEMKAHVDLHTSTSTNHSDHKAYGKGTMGVFRPDLPPMPNTPAAQIKQELEDIYEGN